MTRRHLLVAIRARRWTRRSARVGRFTTVKSQPVVYKVSHGEPPYQPELMTSGQSAPVLSMSWIGRYIKYLRCHYEQL